MKKYKGDEMKDELQNKILEIIEQTQDGIDSVILFGQEQIPDIIQQILIWHGVHSFILWLSCLAGTLLSAWAPVYSNRWKTFIDGEFVCNMFFAIPFFILGVGVFANLEWLQIILAPKLYLLEYAAGLIK